MPEPHTLLLVVHGMLLGRPAALAARRDPVKALKGVKADLPCDGELWCTDGVWRTEVQLQQVYRKAIAADILNVSGDPDYVVAQNEKVLALWDANLKQLAEDPLAIDGLRGWSLKRAPFQQRLTKCDPAPVELVPKTRRPEEVEIAASVRVLLSENSRFHAILGSQFFGDIRSA